MAKRRCRNDFAVPPAARGQEPSTNFVFERLPSLAQGTTERVGRAKRRKASNQDRSGPRRPRFCRARVGICVFIFWFPWTSLGGPQGALCEHAAFAQIPRRRRAVPTDFSEIRVFIFFGSRGLAWGDLRKRGANMWHSLRFRGGGGQVRPTFRKSVFLFFRFP